MVQEALEATGIDSSVLTERPRISELPKWVSCVSQARVLWGRWRLLCFLLFDALSGDP